MMLLNVIAVLGASLQAPAVPEAPAVLLDSDLTLVVQASETCFTAINLGPSEQLLLFSQPETGLLSQLVLFPGERADLPLPDAAEGFLVEAFDGTTPLAPSTGTFAVDFLREPDTGPVWVRRVEREPQAVRVVDAAVVEVETGESLVTSSATATHVPAPVLTPDRDGGAPDRLEPKPLPPI